MRIQYHSRDVNGQRYIWNVHNLLERAKDLPVIDVNLSDIREVDENYWFDEPNSAPPTSRNIAIHAKLINECSLDYPILLCSQGRVMDGMHRVCKALILGHITIKAMQFGSDPFPDYIDVKISDLPHDDLVSV